MHGARHAASFRDEVPDWKRLHPGRQVEPRDLRYGLLPERSQHDLPLGPKGRRRVAAPIQYEDQQSLGSAAVADRRRAIEHLSALFVGVVEDQQGRTLALLSSANGSGRVGGRRACAGVPDGHPPLQGFPGQFSRQTRFSDASRAGDEHHATVPLAGRGHQGDQLRQFPVPAHQHRRAAIECGRQLPRRAAHPATSPARGSPRVVLAGRRPVPHRSARPACCAPCGRPRAPPPAARSGTAPASAVRADARGAASAQPPLRARRRGLRADPARAQLPPEPRTRSNAARRGARFRPARSARRRGRRAVRRARARAPAGASQRPCPDRLSARRGRLPAGARSDRRRAPRLYVEPVRAPVCLESSVAAEFLSQRADTWLWSILCAVGRRLAPQLLDQPIARDQLVGPEDQQRQQSALSARTDLKLKTTIADDLKRAK